MKRKLSAAQQRSELIASYAYGQKTPYEPAPYTPDSDETVICPACEKHNDTDAVFCDQCGAKLEGASDVTTTDTPSVDDGDAELAADVPVANPVDNSGSIENGVVCTTPDCGHLASAHANTGDGENTGKCALCHCEAMSVDVAPNETEAEGVTAAGDLPDDLPADDLEPEVAPPEVEAGQSTGAAFTIPVAVIEGQPTSDGRQIQVGALSWRTPPLPLMGLATETHDPEGWDLNDPAVICGRIDTFERIDQGATSIITAKGFFLPNDDGMYFAELVEAMGRLGVSADIAVEASEVTIDEIDADGWPTGMSEMLTDGTIMGLTICPYAAFDCAYIVLGDGGEQPEPIPHQLAAAGQAIHFLTYEECGQCDENIEVVIASAAPARPPAAWFADPGFTDGDGRLVEILDRRGQRAVGGKYACPVTVESSGRVFGHIAPWGICHTGATGTCILAPRSAANYAHFKRGQHITTAEGERIRVGVLTADAGHAPIRGISATSAMAHYDNTALACADVNIGEDEYGIWIAGAVRPDATDEQIRKLTASSISGDWRQIGGQLELVAALAVNQPGFPLAVVAGAQSVLVAAGATVMHALKHPPVADGGDTVLRKALAPLLTDAKNRARERVTGLR